MATPKQTIYTDMVSRIVREQEVIMGPIAWDEARKVAGIRITPGTRKVALDASDPKKAIDQLVSQYERLFGQASVDVCRDAVKELLAGTPDEEIPASLK